MSEEQDAKDIADAMGDAIALVMRLAIDRKFCPACFLKTFAHAILSYDAAEGFPHDMELRGVSIGEDEHDEDTIGDTAGNA